MREQAGGRLKNAGAPVEWHIYPKTTHCWDCRGLDGRSKTDWRGNRVKYRFSPEASKDGRRRMFRDSSARHAAGVSHTVRLLSFCDALNFQIAAMKRFDFCRSLPQELTKMAVTVRPADFAGNCAHHRVFPCGERRSIWRSSASIQPRLPPDRNGSGSMTRCLTNLSSKGGSFLVSWLSGDEFLGFSTADKIRFGQQANMHLHITNPHCVARGLA